jgi:hypothetical protein
MIYDVAGRLGAFGSLTRLGSFGTRPRFFPVVAMNRGGQLSGWYATGELTWWRWHGDSIGEHLRDRLGKGVGKVGSLAHVG